MDYIFSGFSKKIISCKNNLFKSDLYYKKVNEDFKKFESRHFVGKIKNIWNEYTKDISKSGYLDKFNTTITKTLKNKSKIRVLDLGGGYGDNFYKFKRFNQSKLKKIEYYIVEKNKHLANLGRNFFLGEKSIYFGDKIPELGITIMLSVGTIQYINNFIKTISKIKFESSSYIYLSRSIFSSSDYDFFSVQKILQDKNIEQVIKIHSIKKFTESMNRYNFKIIFLRKNQLLNNLFEDLETKDKIYYYDILLLKS